MAKLGSPASVRSAFAPPSQPLCGLRLRQVTAHQLETLEGLDSPLLTRSRAIRFSDYILAGLVIAADEDEVDRLAADADHRTAQIRPLLRLPARQVRGLADAIVPLLIDAYGSDGVSKPAEPAAPNPPPPDPAPEVRPGSKSRPAPAADGKPRS